MIMMKKRGSAEARKGEAKKLGVWRFHSPVVRLRNNVKRHHSEGSRHG